MLSGCSKQSGSSRDGSDALLPDRGVVGMTRPTPSPDAATEPSTARQRYLQALMKEFDAFDWEQSGRLDSWLRLADDIEAEARATSPSPNVAESVTAASVPPALDDATRLRDWIAKHRTVCPIMRESAEKLHALLAAETPEPEASDD